MNADLRSELRLRGGEIHGNYGTGWPCKISLSKVLAGIQPWGDWRWGWFHRPTKPLKWNPKNEPGRRLCLVHPMENFGCAAIDFFCALFWHLRRKQQWVKELDSFDSMNWAVVKIGCAKMNLLLRAQSLEIAGIFWGEKKRRMKFLQNGTLGTCWQFWMRQILV